jgi:hypothetical protein
MINHKFPTTAIFVSLAASLFSAGAFAQATGETQWQKDHPRRTEVNKRLDNQNARIHQEVKSGQITKAQGAQLHKNDRQIRGEERAMASQNGGHITKTEQKALNQQENANSQKIGK